jgi:hypothetical protein
VGETAEEVDADAQAKAGIIRMLSPRELEAEPFEPPEPPIEGQPPRDKPVSEWTEAEAAAFHAEHERLMREREKAEAQAEAEAEKRRMAEANKTDDQRLGDTISAVLAPGAKEGANRALVESLHDLEGEEGDES